VLLLKYNIPEFLVRVQKHPVRINAAGIALLVEEVIVFPIGAGHVRINQHLEIKAKIFQNY
jgi:hypothetical protein